MPISNKRVFVIKAQLWFIIKLLLEGLTWMDMTWLTLSLRWNKWTFRNLRHSAITWHRKLEPWWINEPEQPKAVFGSYTFYLITSEAVAIPSWYQCLSQINYLEAMLKDVFFTVCPMRIYLISFNLSSFLHQVRERRKLAYAFEALLREWSHLKHDRQPLLSVKAGFFFKWPVDLKAIMGQDENKTGMT